MPETPTPGAHAYTAYCRVLLGESCTLVLPYGALPDLLHDAWEAAAQAVLDHAAFPPLDLHLEDDASPTP